MIKSENRKFQALAAGMLDGFGSIGNLFQPRVRTGRGRRLEQRPRPSTTWEMIGRDFAAARCGIDEAIGRSR